LRAAEIASLPQLVNFGRERWPEFYYGNRVMMQEGNQQTIRQLWADFLSWQDAQNSASQVHVLSPKE
jgi:hypothetical protein